MFAIRGEVNEAIRVTDRATDKLQNHAIFTFGDECVIDGSSVGRALFPIVVELDERSSPQFVLHFRQLDETGKAGTHVPLKGQRLGAVGKGVALRLEQQEASARSPSAGGHRSEHGAANGTGFQIVGTVTEAVRVTDERTNKLQGHAIFDLEGECLIGDTPVGNTLFPIVVTLDAAASPKFINYYGETEGVGEAGTPVPLDGQRLGAIGKRFILTIGS